MKINLEGVFFYHTRSELKEFFLLKSLVLNLEAQEVYKKSLSVRQEIIESGQRNFSKLRKLPHTHTYGKKY